MNPEFRRLVVAARDMNVTVIDRCNPTILMEPGYEDLAEFLAANKVVVTASLPCYQEQNVDQQRGQGAYEESVAGLRLLNSLGYGSHGSGLILNLVYNPDEPILPPDQALLEEDYRRELAKRHKLRFNHLFALANMPISRFGARLIAKNQYYNYMSLLRDAFVLTNLDTVMCRKMISVDYQGFVYDCDFNQMLEVPLGGGNKVHLSDVDALLLHQQAIGIGEHCYGCTAGQGSSCGGALT